jgi:peroxidase
MKPQTRLLTWVLAGGALLGSIAARPLAAQPPGGQPPARFPQDIRTQDGSANNRANPGWGKAGETFRRRTTVAYEDGSGSPAGADRPSARAVSNALAASNGSRPNARGASDFLWQWGQFLDHDLDLTLTADPAEPFDVEVPAGDPHFDPAGTGAKTIALDRSIYRIVRGIREQTNAITAYIDASHVYGSDAERTRALRTLDGTGRLKTSAGNLLPFNEDGLPNAPSDSAAFFVTGDLRANEQVGLLALHTLFLREHNGWADRIRRDNPGLNDDQIFERARAIVGAEIQSITYNEFLPVLLGRGALRPYRGYQPRVNVAIENAFATAAYRLGHSMLSSTLPRLAANGRPIAAGNITLMNAFFNPTEISGPGIEPYLRGMATQRAQELDNQVVDDVRNFLFGPPGAGGFDLASLNIQRGRDHGLPGYNQARTDFGLPRVTSFAQISSDPVVQAKLASVYDSPDQVDLWVGGLAEDHVPGAMVGPTFFVILRDQFERLRDGDRFWYESYLPRDLVQTVREQTLARIIRRNTTIGAEVQPNVFLVRGAR